MLDNIALVYHSAAEFFLKRVSAAVLDAQSNCIITSISVALLL